MNQVMTVLKTHTKLKYLKIIPWFLKYYKRGRRDGGVGQGEKCLCCLFIVFIKGEE